MDVVYSRVCGLDVHKKNVVACIITPDHKEIRTFSTMTEDLLALIDWIKPHGVTHVAMESTGSFWKPIYNLLEAEQIQTLVVNAKHIKQVPGRKTDVKDAEWIAGLLRHGLLRGSLIPDRSQRELRELVRYRRSLIEERAREAQRIQKVLEGANIKLSSVVSDILGKSGRLMLEAIIAGETDAVVLSELAQRKLKNKKPELQKALNGLVGSHQRMMLKMQLRHIDELDRLIEQLDVPSTLIEIEAMIVDVNSDTIDELGVTWGAQAGTTTFGYRDLGLAPSGGLPLDSTSILAPGTIGVSVSNVLAARLHALQTRGKANILSQPSILTADNMGAIIDLSDTFYIQTTGERVATVTPVTVGTSLRVTPRYIEGVGGRREVELTVDIEDGRIQDERRIGSLPTVRRSSISTLAIVGDDQTLLVGGYNSSQDTQQTDKVPLLGDIPLLGAFFSNKSQTVQRRERLFLLRPRVVSIAGEPVAMPRRQSPDTGPAISATWRSDDQPMTAGQYLDLIQGQRTRVRFDAVSEIAPSGPVRAGAIYTQSKALGDVPSVSGASTAGGPVLRVETHPVAP